MNDDAGRNGLVEDLHVRRRRRPLVFALLQLAVFLPEGLFCARLVLADGLDLRRRVGGRAAHREQRDRRDDVRGASGYRGAAVGHDA